MMQHLSSNRRNCKRNWLVLLIVVSLIAGSAFLVPAAGGADQSRSSEWNYPAARHDNVVDNYHGTSVADPYRWLENPESSETQAFVDAQNELTASFVDTPAREKLKQRLTGLLNYPRYSSPEKKGGRYFYWKNDGLQDQSVLFVQESLDGEATVVLDPNLLSEDGTVAVRTHVLSEDGSLFAYGLSESGSDWQELHIRNVNTGEDYSEVLKWCRFTGVAWKHDNSGFYYDRYPDTSTTSPEERALYNKLYWHQLGTPQSEDPLVYEFPDSPDLGFSAKITTDGDYLILWIWHGTDRENRIHYRRVDSNGDFVRLLDDADAGYNFIENYGAIFYFQSDLDAPRGRIIAIDIEQPQRTSWREIVPEQQEVLSDVHAVGNTLLLTYLEDAHHVMKLFDTSGAFVREIKLPTVGSVSGISGRKGDGEMFFSFSSFLYPKSMYRYDLEAGESSTFHEAEIDFDPSLYETEQVFYPSKDGTRIPMFLTHRKGITLDGSHPVILFGYGGFQVNKLPGFSTSVAVWLENGGVYAQACLRGGNEYGEEWHAAGMLENKQNVFDDFIAGAEWLIANKYTNSSRLAIKGGSNGGLLVAACMVQRPELFGAVLCGVPLTDMLRYHRFTVGRFWVGEYGNAEENPDHFKFLYEYSPLHNIEPGTVYPPTLITSADTDDRVVPGHAKKFAAALQAADAGEHPILLRVETRAGHGGGKPTAKWIEATSDVYSFLLRVFDM
jgi:prolyl oligopeptidase